MLHRLAGGISCTTACDGQSAATVRGLVTFLSWHLFRAASSRPWSSLHVEWIRRIINSPLDPILIQINPIHAFTLNFVLVRLLILASAPPSPRQCLSSASPTKPLYSYDYAEWVYYVPACSQIYSSLFSFGLINFCTVILSCANGRQHPSHYPWWSLGCLCDLPPSIVRWERFKHVTLRHRASIKLVYICMYVCNATT
jgi:hypothetical protein